MRDVCLITGSTVFVCFFRALPVFRAIQGVHKVRVHFKKIITLIVFAIEIICKKDLKEENRYFLRFY